MKYKDYEASVKFNEEAEIFYGEVINTRDVITFQGSSVEELKEAFKDSVEDYLEFCRERSEEPNEPFSGNFVVQLSPELYRQLSTKAKRCGKSLNSLIEESLTLINA
ncbi:MAG: type II toxin-antitoxin system HicB family antitoxin [Pyrinomonadaceae bacterium]